MSQPLPQAELEEYTEEVKTDLLKTIDVFLKDFDTKPCVCRKDGNCEYNKGWRKCIEFVRTYVEELTP